MLKIKWRTNLSTPNTKTSNETVAMNENKGESKTYRETSDLHETQAQVTHSMPCAIPQQQT
jgi:hypothetical protein